MQGRDKSKEQLINELAELRQRVAELEKGEGEHKRLKELESESDQLHILLHGLNRAGIGIDIVSTDYRVLFQNQFLQERFGDITGKLCYRNYIGIEKPCDFCPMVKAVKSNKLASIELTAADGSYYAVFSVPLANPDGTVDRAIEIIIDITERKQTEEELRESEEKYKRLFKATPIGITTLDMKGMITSCNPSVYTKGGYSEDDLVGKHFSKITPIRARDIPKFIKVFTSIIRGEVPKPFEVAYHHKDGTTAWTEVHVALLKANGKKVGILVLQMDITERKQAEEALRESQERYRALVNLGGAVGEAIVMLQDTEQGDAIQTFVNREWPRITGYFRKELLGMSFFDLLHPRYHQAALKRHKKRMGGEVIPQLIELSIIRKDGTEVPIEVTSAYSTYKGERANVVFIRDITERKQAEEALLKNRNLLNETGKMAKVGGWEFDTDTLEQTWTEEIYRIHELDMDYQPTVEKGISFYAPEAVPIISEAIQRTIDYGEPFDLELPFITSKGNHRWVHAIGKAYRKDGKTIKVSGTFQDITERKQAEERERRLQQELYLSSRLASIGELAAGVAHQINNPLTGILGFSERLLRKSTDKEATRDLERIHNEAARTAKIVQNLLTFARRHKPKKEYADINDILQKALELRAYELKTGNIEVALDLAPDLPQAIADFNQIEEVFLNLILNAEQAMIETHHGGKLSIKTRQTKDYIRISFADDGPGIPAEHLDRLFDPFFTTRGEKGGTGLGLSICHGIVTEHEGKIYAKSKPGKGSTFFVELPVTTAKTDEGK